MKGGLVNMFVLRKLLKLLLLPVAFVLFFMRWALETSVKLTEWAVGLLTLIVGAAIIYSIVIFLGVNFQINSKNALWGKTSQQ